jgi:hypothetical protein
MTNRLAFIGRRWLVEGAVIAGAVTVFVASTQGVLAAGGSTPGQFAAQQSQGQAFQRAVQLANPYITRAADGTLSLDLTPSVAAAIGSTYVSTFQADLATLDTNVREGRLATTPGGQVYDPKNQTVDIQGGWTGISWQWWGIMVYISNYWTNYLLGLIGSGVGVLGYWADALGLAAVAPELVPVMIVYGAWIAAVNANDSNGVIVNLPYLFVPPYITGQ